jgi:hypothetical protein
MRTPNQQRVISMSASSFDPINSLSSHIAILTMVEDMKDQVAKSTSLLQLAAKSLGRELMTELEESHVRMKANRMWVYDVPIGERQYRYSLHGNRQEYEIPTSELVFYRRMKMGDILRKNEMSLTEG